MFLEVYKDVFFVKSIGLAVLTFFSVRFVCSVVSVLFVLVLLRFGSRPERSSPVPPSPETLASSGRR